MGTKSENKQKYGMSEGPIPCTRCLALPLDHFHEKGIKGFALVAINDVESTWTSVNVYDGKTGKGYDASQMTFPLPDPKSDKWKNWKRKGYAEAAISDFDVLEAIEVEEKIQA